MAAPGTNHGLSLDFLSDGGQSADTVADHVAGFVREARRSLDVAIYDFHAREGASSRIADALEEAAGRGVAVRVAFNVERIRHPAAPRPPLCDPDEIDGLEVPTRGVRGEGALMHHKYVVRDGQSVLTGSTNWTDDSFSREENVMLRIDSPVVAEGYTANIEQLWSKGKVETSGGAGRRVGVGPGSIQPFFSPKGPLFAHVVATRLGEARHRVRILSPVLTAGAVLGTLAELAGRESFDLAGAYDLTQMEEVQEQWARVPANRWKLDAWRVIAPRLSGKRSTPYREGAVHDYMHAKVVVVDGRVLTGSYNLSRGGADNAENLLDISNGAAAERFAEFAERVAARYSKHPAVPSPAPAMEP
jgi:phosphatidylserine/phosphatidylglycerophosphate/cardiolipin synthase-like enzyme